MSYMELLPEVEHRIVLAESGEELKKPFMNIRNNGIPGKEIIKTMREEK